MIWGAKNYKSYFQLFLMSIEAEELIGLHVALYMTIFKSLTNRRITRVFDLGFRSTLIVAFKFPHLPSNC